MTRIAGEVPYLFYPPLLSNTGLLTKRFGTDIQKELFRATDERTLQIALDNWELVGRSMVRTKKTPQHTLWWYWEAFLIFAFAEWLLRRRKGLS